MKTTSDNNVQFSKTPSPRYVHFPKSIDEMDVPLKTFFATPVIFFPLIILGRTVSGNGHISMRL